MHQLLQHNTKVRFLSHSLFILTAYTHIHHHNELHRWLRTSMIQTIFRKDNFKLFSVLPIPVLDDKTKLFSKENCWNSRPEDITTLTKHRILYEAQGLQSLIDSALSADGVLDEDSVCEHCHREKVCVTSLHGLHMYFMKC